MCYDIKASLESQLKRAKRNNDLAAILEIEQKLAPYTDLPAHHKSGFAHPKLLIYTAAEPFKPIIAQWGLIPHWVKDSELKNKLWNSTINARGETLAEKPSFRDAYKSKRCLVYLDGFYEHHHQDGETYPFYIYQNDESPLCLAGLWSEWTDRDSGEVWTTFSLVTTKANSMMAKIHNNPKAKEARMPVLLNEAEAELWLNADANQPEQKEALAALIRPWTGSDLAAHPVAKLRGKNYQGNIPEITKKVHYDELKLTL
jgi:putative SOS response-associated peptidase YedK